MSWGLRVFFGLLGACAVIAALWRLRDLLAGERSGRAVVKRRWSENFPLSTAWTRKDRREYYVTFLLPEDGGEVTLCVQQALYSQLTVGSVGTLTWQGTGLRSFQADGPGAPGGSGQTG